MDHINKFIHLIEEGILSYYLDKDYSITSSQTVEEPESTYTTNKAEFHKRAKNLLFKAKMGARKEKLGDIMAEAENRLKEILNKGEGKVYNLFKQKIIESGLQVSYRNFDKMSEEEMKSILTQLDLTQLLDEIESELENE